MILVTGSTGYIGFHVCEMLELKKIPYFAIDNFSRSLNKNIINKKKFLKIDINSNNIPSLLKSKKYIPSYMQQLFHFHQNRKIIKKFIIVIIF